MFGGNGAGIWMVRENKRIKLQMKNKGKDYAVDA